MKTLHLKETAEDIKKAAEIIKKGGLVAFPTETVYGLGANGLDAKAAAGIYKAKGRPSDNPMILHISELSELHEITDHISDNAIKMAEAFWPGPLTMIFQRNDKVPDVTTGGLDTVGVRMPSDHTARALIKESGVPIAAPSANLSGKPSPTKASHVAHDMDGRIDAIIYGGDCAVGIESTVVSVKDDEIVILRPGKITAADMEAVTGLKVSVDPAIALDKDEKGKGPSDNEDKDFKPMAPGMKYRHYAPDAEMLVIEGEADKVKAEIEKRKKDLESEGKKVGVIFFGTKDFDEAAHDLFARLREMDEQQVDVILAGAVEKTGLGYAVMNRMLKSAGNNVIKV